MGTAKRFFNTFKRLSNKEQIRYLLDKEITIEQGAHLDDKGDFINHFVFFIAGLKIARLDGKKWSSSQEEAIEAAKDLQSEWRHALGYGLEDIKQELLEIEKWHTTEVNIMQHVAGVDG